MPLSLYDMPGTPETAGQEGSRECTLVLLTLNRWRGGLTLREIRDEINIDEDHTRAALLGLQRRDRVVCDGRGTAALWRVANVWHFHLITPAQVARPAVVGT